LGFGGVNSTQMLRSALLVLSVGLLLALDADAQSGAGVPPVSARRDPQLKERPTAPKSATEIGGIHLDVVVTDGAGNPVVGLEPNDFTILDNDRPQKILNFQHARGSTLAGEPFVQVFVVLDTVNSSLVSVAMMRSEAEKFLQQNGGHLAEQVTLLLTTDAGPEVLAAASTDGNALAKAVRKMDPKLHTIRSATGAEAARERLQLSVRTLATITSNLAKRPGRKLVIWMGPGWPIMQDAQTYDARIHQLNFNAIESLTNGLREARTVVCSAGGGAEYFVRDYLSSPRSVHETQSSALALQVFAVHSGGRTLDAGNRGNLAEEVNKCVQGIGPYYRLSFNFPPDLKADEFHSLKVLVDKPGMTVRTSAGYYGEP